MIIEDKSFECKCERCKHYWHSLARKPELIKVCPKCKSPYWNTPKNTIWDISAGS